MFLKISQNSLENTCGFCQTSKNTFYYRTPLVAASVNWLLIKTDWTKWCQWRQDNLANENKEYVHRSLEI